MQFGRPSKGGLRDDATRRAHERIERQRRRPLLGRDDPVDERLAARRLDREDHGPGREQDQRQDEAAGETDEDQQRDVEGAAKDRGVGTAREQAVYPRMQHGVHGASPVRSTP